MTTRLLARASVLFVLLFALSGAAFGNNSWIGTLLDAAGKPVAGAAAHLHSNSDGHDYESRTNGAGEFHFESVVPGVYRISGNACWQAWALAASFSITGRAQLTAS